MLSVRRFIRYGLFLGAVSGTAVALNHNDWIYSNNGLVRFGRAFFTIADVAIDYKFSLLGDPNSSDYQAVKSDIHWRSAKKLLKLCEKNGGAFIKVGQHVGTMDYILPYEYVNTLKVLHNSAPKSPTSDILKVVEEDLHKKPDEIFCSFDPEPIGSASLAQVHKAVLLDGTEVAVKVQHPYVLGNSYVDMKTMELLVNLVTILFPEFKFKWLADEMKKNLPVELQFLNEGKNSEEVARRFQKYPWLKIPKVFWDLSTDRVLTMEFCRGGQINDLNYMLNHNINTKLVSERLGLLYSEMIFSQGFVHCDPHPGNILVEASSEGPRIVLLDHGLYTTLTKDFRLKYCQLWMSLLSADVAKIKTSADALGVGHLYAILSAMVTARSWTAITEGIERKQVTETENQEIQRNAARVFPQITEVLENIPREMILVIKTNDLLRGIDYTLKGTPGTSFIPMHNYCLQATFEFDLKECKSSFCRMKVILFYKWAQFRINLYNFLLKISHICFNGANFE